MRLDAPLLSRLLGGAPARRPLPAAFGVSFHSGRTRPGDAFFAFKGASGHGIEHAQEALDRGAAYVVSDHPHPHGVQVADARAALLDLGGFARSRMTAPVIAIGGSAGKTSAKAFAAAALAADASPGN